MSDKPDNTPDSAPSSTPSPIGEIEHGPSGFEQFLDKNQKKLVIGGSLLIVALVGYVIIDGLKSQAQKDAAASVSAAGDITEYRAAADAHSGTTAAGTALYLIAQEQWKDQRQQEAIETLNQFISENPDHPLFINAKGSLASYHLQLDELDKAKTLYNEIAEAGKGQAGSGHELYPFALITLGDIARREGDNEAAKAFYERIGTEFQQKSVAGIKKLATERLALVGVSDPVLKKPEPPKPPVVPGAPDIKIPGAPEGVQPPKVNIPPNPAKPSGIKLPTEPKPGGTPPAGFPQSE